MALQHHRKKHQKMTKRKFKKQTVSKGERKNDELWMIQALWQIGQARQKQRKILSQ